jgi:transposase
MNKVTMIGCDLHDRFMLLMVAANSEKPVKKSFETSRPGEMIAWLQDFARRHDSARIVFAYEASGQGFGLYDQLTEAGIECYVLAPTHLPHTTHRRKNKTDEKDAQMILDEVRAHVLAGRELPAVWIPDPQTRDDREPVRLRLRLAEQRTQIRNQIRSLAKRSQLSFPGWFTKNGEWSRRSLQWLHDVADGKEGTTKPGARAALGRLVLLYESFCIQLRALDEVIDAMAQGPRYSKPFRKVKLLKGVGTLTAMVFLTEIGDLNRFANRRQLAAYLGLAPSAHESGERNDCKGRITRQGPSQVRHVLCQAAWTAIRCSEEWRATYDRIRAGSKPRNKIAIVAVMRKLGITMWQTARSAEVDQLIKEIDGQKTNQAGKAA